MNNHIPDVTGYMGRWSVTPGYVESPSAVNGQFIQQGQFLDYGTMMDLTYQSHLVRSSDGTQTYGYEASVIVPGWSRVLPELREPFCIQWVSEDRRISFMGQVRLPVGYLDYNGFSAKVRLSEFRMWVDASPRPGVARQEGAYRAFRLWKVEHYPTSMDPRLAPVVARTNVPNWVPGWNVAVGYSKNTHTGGFYGLNSLAETIGQAGGLHGHDYYYGFITPDNGPITRAFGTFLGGGRIIRATKGLRAQRALPETLIEIGDVDHDIQLLPLADKYGMRVITMKEALELETGIVPYTETDSNS